MQIHGIELDKLQNLKGKKDIAQNRVVQIDFSQDRVVHLHHWTRPNAGAVYVIGWVYLFLASCTHKYIALLIKTCLRYHFVYISIQVVNSRS